MALVSFISGSTLIRAIVAFSSHTLQYAYSCILSQKNLLLYKINESLFVHAVGIAQSWVLNKRISDRRQTSCVCLRVLSF